jgi:hypothetical protein
MFKDINTTKINNNNNINILIKKKQFCKKYLIKINANSIKITNIIQ